MKRTIPLLLILSLLFSSFTPHASAQVIFGPSPSTTTTDKNKVVVPALVVAVLVPLSVMLLRGAFAKTAKEVQKIEPLSSDKPQATVPLTIKDISNCAGKTFTVAFARNSAPSRISFSGGSSTSVFIPKGGSGSVMLNVNMAGAKEPSIHRAYIKATCGNCKCTVPEVELQVPVTRSAQDMDLDDLEGRVVEKRIDVTLELNPPRSAKDIVKYLEKEFKNDGLKKQRIEKEPEFDRTSVTFEYNGVRSVAEMVRALLKERDVLLSQPVYLYELFGNWQDTLCSDVKDGWRKSLNLDAVQNLAKGGGERIVVLDTEFDSKNKHLNGWKPDEIIPLKDLSVELKGLSQGNRRHDSGGSSKGAGAVAAKNPSSGDAFKESNNSSCSPDLYHATPVVWMAHQVAPSAKIILIQVGSANIKPNSDTIAAGLRKAMEIGKGKPLVINMSFGKIRQKVSKEEDEKVSNALRALRKERKKDIVLVASAGNNGQDSEVSYPASHDAVVSVSSLNCDESLADYAPKKGRIDFVTIGQDIEILGKRSCGTSFSSPQIAGIYALLLQQSSVLPANHPREWLATRPGKCGGEFGRGIPDIVATLKGINPLSPKKTIQSGSK